MSNTIRFRTWQRACLEAVRDHTLPDFLAVATPGGGKSLLGMSAHHLFHKPKRLIVVAPTTHLKDQWASVAARFGIQLDTGWVPSQSLAPGFHGIVTTYAHLGGAGVAECMARESHGAFVILDEVHHAADKRTWGTAVSEAFDPAAFRLSLSGTPFRSDDAMIPFVRYVDGEAEADFVYGYGEALADGGVVRPVEFGAVGGEFAWLKDGEEFSASFDDTLDKPLQSARLKAALSLDGDWLPSVLSEAAVRLDEMRRTDPIAAGLVIATKVTHAKDIAKRLSALTGREAVVVTSDDPKASALISDFTVSDAPWIVAVKMVSEGVDIPRLRVGVYATTTTTELFFRQAVGRYVRWRSDLPDDQDAVLFVPDDPRLRRVIFEFSEHRIHVAKQKANMVDDEFDDEDSVLAEFEAEFADNEEGFEPEGSLFQVLSATTTGSQIHQPLPGVQSVDPIGDVLVLELPSTGSVIPLAKRRETLRSQNQEAANQIAAFTRLSQQTVNNELNRLAAIRGGVAKASGAQMERRLQCAEAWLRRLGR